MDGADFEIEAGDRMPYFLVNGKSVYDWLHQPCFHLADLRGRSERGHEDIKSEIEREYAGLVDYHVLPLQPRAGRNLWHGQIL